MPKAGEPSGAHQSFGDIAPKLADITDRILFGEVWPGQELTQRDRSMVTVTALIAGGHTEQLPFHLKKALSNGVTHEEILGIITHLAFYAGWPRAMSAIEVVRKVFGEARE